MKITSVNNDLIKETAKLLKSKYREETSYFLIEGEKAVKEALEFGVKISNIFVLEGYTKVFNHEIIEVNEAVMSKITDAKSAPKIVAVAEQLIYNKEDFKKAKNLILLEDIKDPGNLGTIIRTAVAFNIDGIILYGDTVDLYNPKCVRSAVGNLWKIPIISISNIPDLKNTFKDFQFVSTLPLNNNVIELNNYKFDKKNIVMFGSEANGLSSELKKISTKAITIPMSTNVESLNLSISAGIIMYSISTQQI